MFVDARFQCFSNLKVEVNTPLVVGMSAWLGRTITGMLMDSLP